MFAITDQQLLEPRVFMCVFIRYKVTQIFLLFSQFWYTEFSKVFVYLILVVKLIGIKVLTIIFYSINMSVMYSDNFLSF